MKPLSKALALVLTAALLVAVASAASAGPPTDQLRARIERVLKVVGDPDLKKESKTAERRATLRAIAGEIFDFAEITRRTLGPHWASGTPAQREELVQDRKSTRLNSSHRL